MYNSHSFSVKNLVQNKEKPVHHLGNLSTFISDKGCLTLNSKNTNRYASCSNIQSYLTDYISNEREHPYSPNANSFLSFLVLPCSVLKTQVYIFGTNDDNTNITAHCSKPVLVRHCHYYRAEFILRWLETYSEPIFIGHIGRQTCLPIDAYRCPNTKS